MRIEALERGAQPLAAFPVERRDAAAQPRDRGGQIAALVFEPRELRRGVGRLAFCEQVDGTDRVALAQQPVEPDGEVAAVEHRRVAALRDQRRQGFRGLIEPVGDLGPQPRQSVGRGLAPRLQPGTLFARLGDGGIGPACRLGRLTQPGFPQCQCILGGALLGGSACCAAGERLAFAGDRRRAGGQFGDFRG